MFFNFIRNDVKFNPMLSFAPVKMTMWFLLFIQLNYINCLLSVWTICHSQNKINLHIFYLCMHSWIMCVNIFFLGNFNNKIMLCYSLYTKWEYFLLVLTQSCPGSWKVLWSFFLKKFCNCISSLNIWWIWSERPAGSEVFFKKRAYILIYLTNLIIFMVCVFYQFLLS